LLPIRIEGIDKIQMRKLQFYSESAPFPSRTHTRIQKAKGSLLEFFTLAEKLNPIISQGKVQEDAAKQLGIARLERMKAIGN
jgi:hypothetical protein